MTQEQVVQVGAGEVVISQIELTKLRNKPTNPLDVPFGVGLAIILFVLLGPFLFLWGKDHSQPPPLIDGRETFRSGMVVMCQVFAQAQATPMPPDESEVPCGRIADESLSAGAYTGR